MSKNSHTNKEIALGTFTENVFFLIKTLYSDNLCVIRQRNASFKLKKIYFLILSTISWFRKVQYINLYETKKFHSLHEFLQVLHVSNKSLPTTHTSFGLKGVLNLDLESWNTIPFPFGCTGPHLLVKTFLLVAFYLPISAVIIPTKMDNNFHNHSDKDYRYVTTRAVRSDDTIVLIYSYNQFSDLKGLICQCKTTYTASIFTTLVSVKFKGMLRIYKYVLVFFYVTTWILVYLHTRNKHYISKWSERLIMWC